MLPRIAYVTTSADPDADTALAALERARLDAYALAWDTCADWADFDLVVARTATLDPSRRQQFLRWAREVEDLTELANPARMLVRFSDLTYLRDFARESIPTSSAIWVEPGDDIDEIADAVGSSGWASFLVTSNVADEPVAAGSAAEAAATAGTMVRAGSIALIQPGVAAQRVSAVIIGGRFSHAVEERGDRVALDAEAAEIIESALASAAGGDPLLYARIDLERHDGAWSLRRFHVSGGTLFLDDSSADRLADAVRSVISPDVRDSLPGR